MAREQRVKLDADAVTWLLEEQDEQRQTSVRLRLERGMAYGERDQVILEHDEAQQRISSL